ncbi:MAG: hypothetical protein LBR74_02505 [Eubacterium sp.]|jgi:hypothetical protein|nr:hypothetical protein [Eubacterium sp.]
MKKILLLEDEQDVAIGTLKILKNHGYDCEYVSNIIDFNALLLDDIEADEKDRFYGYIMDLQIDTGLIPIEDYKKIISAMFYKNEEKSEEYPMPPIGGNILYGWYYYKHIIRNNSDDRFKNLHKKIILITGHFEAIKENKFLDDYPDINIIKKRGEGTSEELLKALGEL